MTKPETPAPLFRSKAAAVLPASLGAFLAVMYAFAMQFDFEYDIGHFERNSVFFVCAAAAAVLGLLLAVVAALSSGKKVFDPLPAPSPLSCFGAVLAAAMCLLIFFRTLLSYAQSIPEEGVTPEKLALGSAVLGLVLGVSVLLNLSPNQRGGKPLPLIAAVLGAFSVNLSMFAAYFDFTVPLNSPVRNLTTLTQAAVLLFLLSEARLVLVKDKMDLPVPFQMFTAVAAAVFGIGIGGGGALWRLIRSFSFGSEIVAKTPEPNLALTRLALYFAVGCIALDRLRAAKDSLRRLTDEEIAEIERKAKEEKEKKKNKGKTPEEPAESA